MFARSIELVFILMTLAIGVTAAAKKIDRPYPIALVLIGALIGSLPFLRLFGEIRGFFVSDELFRTAIIAVFLPALIGEAALKLSIKDIKENLRAIILLAFLATLFAFVVTGVLTYVWLGTSLGTALVYGALMSATDPVSVISVFKSMGVNKRIAVIMEGESLINDGVAVVLFKISAYSLPAILALGPLGVTVGFLEFLKVVLGGTIVGLTLGYTVSYLTKFFDDYPLEIAFSILLFYGAYFTAESYHVSGVIAVLTAGLVLGNYGTNIGMSPTTRLSVTVFWDALTLIANSLVFILVGLELTSINMLEHIEIIIAAIVIVLVGRSLSVYLTTAGTKMPMSWKHVLNWGGLRGSLSLALALSLPYSFSGRETILIMTFGVVFFSLVVQGLTIAQVIQFFGLNSMTEGLKEYETATFEFQQALAAHDEIEFLYSSGRISPQVYEKIKAENVQRADAVRLKLDDFYETQPELLRQQERNARKKLLYAEHHAVEQLINEGVLNAKVGEARKKDLLEQIEKI